MGKIGLDLKEAVRVGQLADQGLHVIGASGILGDDGIEAFLELIGIQITGQPLCLFQIILGQVADQGPDLIHTLILIGRPEVGHPGDTVVGHGPAQGLG